MKKETVKTIFCVTCLLLIMGPFGIRRAGGVTENEGSGVNFQIDFTDHEQGPVEAWLRAKGFEFEMAATDRSEIALGASQKGLTIEAKQETMGLFIRKGLELEKFSAVRVRWGVDKYPAKASYEERVHNEALMLYVFFGRDKLPSGHFAVPPSPYFIALYLGREDELHKPYLGKFYHKGGRFVCVGSPRPGEHVVTRFDLVAHFRKFYQEDTVPRISGIALGLDTTESGDGGRAAAFIKKLEILDTSTLSKPSRQSRL